MPMQVLGLTFIAVCWLSAADINCIDLLFSSGRLALSLFSAVVMSLKRYRILQLIRTRLSATLHISSISPTLICNGKRNITRGSFIHKTYFRYAAVNAGLSKIFFDHFFFHLIYIVFF